MMMAEILIMKNIDHIETIDMTKVLLRLPMRLRLDLSDNHNRRAGLEQEIKLLNAKKRLNPDLS
jgi:hypothetical protein